MNKSEEKRLAIQARQQILANVLARGEKNFAEEAKLSHEHRCIARVCREFGFPKAPITAAFQELGGNESWQLRWEAFEHVHPDFPILVRSTRIIGLTDSYGMEGPNFFRYFHKSKLAQEFVQLVDTLEMQTNGRPTCLIAPYGNIPGGIMMHTANGLFAPGPAWAWRPTRDDRDTPFWVEPFHRCLAVLAGHA